MHVTDKPFVEQFKWRKLESAGVWRPKQHGEEISGYYLGRTLRNGKYGQYEVVIIETPDRGILTVSGTLVINAIDINRVPEQTPVRMVFEGIVESQTSGRWYNKISVYVADVYGATRRP